MSPMTIKEWAAAHRADNAWHEQELTEQLPLESPAGSVRSYFALRNILVKISGEAEETGELWELRMQHYRDLIDKWQRLANRQHARQP
jgi:hypothetical protein